MITLSVTCVVTDKHEVECLLAAPRLAYRIIREINTQKSKYQKHSMLVAGFEDPCVSPQLVEMLPGLTELGLHVCSTTSAALDCR